jgi:hypothetical protein
LLKDDEMMDLETSRENPTAVRISGRAVVIAMFVFGAAVTGAMWLYWTMNSGAFRPLQDALAAEFPGSLPRVDGGQHKMQTNPPRILRATLKVEFDPTRETARGEQVLSRVEQIARRHVNLADYDILQVFLYYGIPEKNLVEREFSRDLKPNQRLAD